MNLLTGYSFLLLPIRLSMPQLPAGSNTLLPLLQANLKQLRTRMAAACARSGREINSVQLVAVTKSASVDAIAGLMQCGQLVLAENRPQQLIERATLLNPLVATTVCSTEFHSADAKTQWHLIGQLQSNKIRSILPWVQMIHSIESLKQLIRVNRIAGELGLTPTVLLEVNISGENSKGGFSPDQLLAEWEAIRELKQVRTTGLMTMAPFTEDLEQIRNTFRGLREFRDQLVDAAPGHALPELSMGMSHDFEIAIEEGATLIRVGSLLFEGCSS